MHRGRLLVRRALVVDLVMLVEGEDEAESGGFVETGQASPGECEIGQRKKYGSQYAADICSKRSDTSTLFELSGRWMGALASVCELEKD